MGPHTLRIVDRSLALLDGLPLDLATAITILQSVTTYVTGVVVREPQELRLERQQEQSGGSAEEMEAEARVWGARLQAAGGLEHFVQIFEQNVDPDAARETREQRFAFGLNCLRDGIAVYVRGLSRPLRPANQASWPRSENRNEQLVTHLYPLASRVTIFA